jgi:putative transposase
MAKDAKRLNVAYPVACFKCVECYYTNNADVVGSLNVLERGHRLLACEVSGAVMPPATGTCR